MMLDMLSLGPWPVLFALIGGFAVFVVCMIVIDRKGLEEDGMSFGVSFQHPGLPSARPRFDLLTSD
jgi:hypothetical protein